jgi:hypothetical protein
LVIIHSSFPELRKDVYSPLICYNISLTRVGFVIQISQSCHSSSAYCIGSMLKLRTAPISLLWVYQLCCSKWNAVNAGGLGGGDDDALYQENVRAMAFFEHHRSSKGWFLVMRVFVYGTLETSLNSSKVL